MTTSPEKPMRPETELFVIDKDALIGSVRRAAGEGFRLVQISATRAGETMELTYSFDADFLLRHYRVILREGESIESVSAVYSAAFLYENEIHDLFGITVRDMSVNYKGTFYKLARRMPYSFAMKPKTAGARD